MSGLPGSKFAALKSLYFDGFVFYLAPFAFKAFVSSRSCLIFDCVSRCLACMSDISVSSSVRRFDAAERALACLRRVVSRRMLSRSR